MNKKVFLYVKAFSDLGTFMDLIAINVLMYAATGSSAWLAATMAFRTLGGLLSSVFSGVLADRFDRRKNYDNSSYYSFAVNLSKPCNDHRCMLSYRLDDKPVCCQL